MIPVFTHQVLTAAEAKDEFDIIIFTEVMEHLNFNPKPTLKKIHDLLKMNGRLYLSTPDASDWGRITKYYKSIEEMPNPKNVEKIIDDHIYQYKKEELHPFFIFEFFF